MRDINYFGRRSISAKLQHNLKVVVGDSVRTTNYDLVLLDRLPCLLCHAVVGRLVYLDDPGSWTSRDFGAWKVQPCWKGSR